MDAREEAVQAKLEGAKSRQKEISNNIRKLVQGTFFSFHNGKYICNTQKLCYVNELEAE